MTKKLSKNELKRRNFLLRNSNLLGFLYPNCVFYGPYLSKDGRYRVVFYDGKSRKTRQYAKVKMEIKLERLIEEPETVDHSDMNTRNDKYSNLEIINRRDHARNDVKRIKPLKVCCVWCGTYFVTKRYSLNRNKAGPFCSKICSGKYGAYVQKGGTKLNRKIYKRKYYTLKQAA